MMGNTHLDSYRRRDDVEVVALADANADRLEGREKAGGNIEGQAQGENDFEDVTRYAEASDLIEQEDCDIIDVCLPTPLHLQYALQAVEKGCHVLVEKPVCRTAEQAEQLVEAQRNTTSLIMPAMCIRFWPGWDTLIEAIGDERYGKLYGLSIQRLASHPGGAFYSDAEACGGALLDLHIHDTDFIYAALGMPTAVTTVGYSKVTDGPDHVSTQYHFADNLLVVAEGGWSMTEGFPFTMRYDANFEKATLRYNLGAEKPLTVIKPDGSSETPDLDPEMGYWREIDYFLNCVKSGKQPETVTVENSLQSLRINEAERASLQTRQPVNLG